MSYDRTETRVAALEALARAAGLLLEAQRYTDATKDILEAIQAETKLIRNKQQKIEPTLKE